MKKTLLTLALALTGFAANSQVIFSVESPSSIAGNYELSYATSGAGWGTPDMLDPANVVIDTIVMAYDSSPTADSLMCLAAAAGSLNGKIAMLYRGDCEFGTKAARAKAAGAIAVIIVNNVSGAPISMSPGSGSTPAGAAVNIPVIMITLEAGAAIHAKLIAGEHVVGFIGNKAGYYGVDLGTSASKVMTPSIQSIPLSIAQNATEFPVDLAAFAFNYGSILQTGVTMNAKVTKGGATIYDQNSAAFDFIAASPTSDSVWIDFPVFAPTSYSVGIYEITYTIISPEEDEYPADNTFVTRFEITDDMISLAPLDANGLPKITGGIQPNPSTGNSFKSCVVFRNANASRLGAQGLYFGISKNAADGALTGEEVLIQGYRWNNQFTDLDDPNFAYTSMEELSSGSYTYTADLKDTILYKAFDVPFVMLDNQRYLFCITTFSADYKVFHAYNTEVNYNQLELAEGQPFALINNGGEVAQWGAFASRPIPAIGIKTFPAAELGLADNKIVEASVYPNPAKETVTISVKGFNGDAQMTVSDVAGKVVINKTVSTDENGNVKVNMNELNNGIYVFNLQLADGTVSKFNVVINK